MLAFLYMLYGSCSGARIVSERALSLSRTAGDKRGISVAASNLGHVLAHEGRIEEALRLQRVAVLLAHEQFDLQGIGGVLLDVAALSVAATETTR